MRYKRSSSRRSRSSWQSRAPMASATSTRAGPAAFAATGRRDRARPYDAGSITYLAFRRLSDLSRGQQLGRVADELELLLDRHHREQLLHRARAADQHE